MGHSPVEERPRDPGASTSRSDRALLDRLPLQAAGIRPVSPRSSRPLPVSSPVTAAPRVPPLPPAGPIQVTAFVRPPPPPLAIAASTRRKAEVTQIVAPLPPPVPPPARALQDRPPSPRVIAGPAAEPATAEAPPPEAPTDAPTDAPADAPTLAKADHLWAEIRSGNVTYHFIGMSDRDILKVPDRREASSRLAGASRHAAPTHWIWLRTAVIGVATLIAATLVVAIGFSSGDLPRARAATERDHAAPPDPRPSPGPARTPAPRALATTPAPTAAPAQRAPKPAAAAEAARPLSVAAPSEEARSAATTAPPSHPRPRSPATSSSRSGHARPAGHTRAPSARPMSYDPDALFLDKR